MSCKYNYTLEERPQRCLECKEPMCGSRIPKGYEFVQRVPAMVMTYKDDNGEVVKKVVGGGAFYGIPNKEE